MHSYWVIHLDLISKITVLILVVMEDALVQILKLIDGRN